MLDIQRVLKYWYLELYTDRSYTYLLKNTNSADIMELAALYKQV